LLKSLFSLLHFHPPSFRLTLTFSFYLYPSPLSDGEGKAGIATNWIERGELLKTIFYSVAFQHFLFFFEPLLLFLSLSLECPSPLRDGEGKAGMATNWVVKKHLLLRRILPFPLLLL